MNFEEVYKEFLIYAQKRHKKQGFYTLTHDFNLYIVPYFKDMDIQKITRTTIINWQNYILDLNFSNSYNLKLYYTLSSFFKYCIFKDYIQVNLVLSVPKFPRKIENYSYNIYNICEFRKFRRGIDNIIYKEFFNFLYFNGTRCGEALALKFSDIKGFYISINKNMQRRGKREIDTPKNTSSIRTIKINFLQYFRLFKLYLYYFKIYGVKPLSCTTIDRYKHNACLKSHVKEIKVHEFRHSYTTRMIHKKIPIDYVSRQLGHSKVSTTLDVYLHQEKKLQSNLFPCFDFFTLTHDFKKIITLLKH